MGSSNRRTMLAALAAVVLLAGCGSGGSDSGPASGAGTHSDGTDAGPGRPALAELARAAKLTPRSGTAKVHATVENHMVGYELAGRIDLRPPYRACLWVEGLRGLPDRGFGTGTLLWLAGGRGANARDKRRVLWDHVVRFARGDRRGRCRSGGFWLADHPPTLPLREGPAGYVVDETSGAEVYLHLGMTALAGLGEGAIEARPAGSPDAFEVEVDFHRFEEERPLHGLDARDVVDLLHRTGTGPITATLDEDGRLTGLELTAPRAATDVPAGGPVRVSVALAELGEPPPVPAVAANVYE